MSIRDFLLNKAVRDLSRLVKVKRLRQTKNGVVPAYVWVRPSQILKTDVIVQNAHNAVSLGNGLYAPAKGVWDRRYFASLAKTDKKKAMEYAQSLGITWVRDSNAGKDWLRAFKAVKDYSKPHTQIQTPTAPQATIQPTPTPKATKPKAQTPTATQQTIATVVLDKKQVDEINNEQNARRKVVILTHYLGQDGAKDYAKQIGLTWKDDPNDASLTWRRVRRALRHKFESGYQVVATVTPTQPTVDKPKATKAKATKAKTTAPKAKADKPTAKQPEPKVDKSLLEIDPTKMTQREQNIASLLNKCTDAEALKIFAKAGIVGEDDQATEFVKKQLYEGYYKKYNKIPSSILDRRDYDVQKVSLDLLLKRIGTKLELPKNEVLKPFLKVLSSGYDNTYPSSEFASIMDAHRLLGNDAHRLDAISRNLAKIYDYKGVSSALDHIVKEQPELKSSANYLASEYSAFISTCTNEEVLNSVIRCSFPWLQITSSKKHDPTTEYTESVEKLKNTLKAYNIDVDDFINDLFDKDIDFDETYKNGKTFREILADVPNGFRRQIALLSLKSGKPVEELAMLTDSDFKSVVDKTFASLSIPKYKYISESLTSGTIKHLSEQYQKYAFINSPKFNDAIEHYLKFTGFEIRDVNSGDSIQHLKDIPTEDLLNCLQGSAILIDGAKYKLTANTELSSNMKTLYTNLMYTSRVLTAFKSTNNYAYKLGVRMSTILNSVPDELFDHMPTMSVKDHESIMNKAKEECVNAHLDLDDPRNMDRALCGMGILTTEKVSDLESGVAKLFRDSVQMLASYSVGLNAKMGSDKRIAYVDELLGYNQIDTTPKKQVSPKKLKDLREKALSKCNCTLKTADQATYDSVDRKVKQDWDKGKLGESGKRLYGHISFVNNGVYHINNSVAEERFNNAVQSLDQKNDYNTPNNSSANKKYFDKSVHTLYHGTDFRGGCGIIGVDGRFRDMQEAQKIGQKTAGAMLGQGVYLADLAGKSAGYFGEWGGGYNKRGALLVCDAVLGNHHESNDYFDVDSDYTSNSVSVTAGTSLGGGRTLRADEWCVRDQSLVFPKMIIDAEAVRR